MKRLAPRKMMRKIKEMIGKIGLILSIFLSLSAPSYAQTIAEVANFVHTPFELTNWLSHNFAYEMELPDHWQGAKETLELKKGDCEDFAILNQAVLGQLGIASEIVIVKFKGLNLSHAICIFKNGEFYSYFSNKELVQTKARSIKEAIEKEYPDWEKLIFTNAKKENLKIVSNSNSL